LILLDTSGLLAAIDSKQPDHRAAAGALFAATGPRLLSPFVLAELDYLVATRVGTGAEMALIEEIGRGAYQLEAFSNSDAMTAHAIIRRYEDLQLGLADASLVVLAQRYGCRDLLTLDERHFRVVLGPDDTPFRLLPSDRG
jgi:predicted nucleic acid-binding protein